MRRFAQCAVLVTVLICFGLNGFAAEDPPSSEEAGQATPLPPPPTPATPEPSYHPFPIDTEKASYEYYRIHSFGFSVGWTPLYRPDVREELSSDLSSDFEVALRLPGSFGLGVRYATGNISRLVLPGGSVGTDLTHRLYALYGEWDLPLNAPYGVLGPFQVIFPLSVSCFDNQIDAHGVKYGNLGIDFATGIGVRLHTRTIFVLETLALYHLGFPFSKIRENGSSPAVTGISGEEASGKTNGFELRVSLIFFLSDLH